MDASIAVIRFGICCKSKSRLKNCQQAGKMPALPGVAQLFQEHSLMHGAREATRPAIA
jgi:hypothetical protein